MNVTSSSAGGAAAAGRTALLAAGVVLSVIVFAAFWRVGGHAFIPYDDDRYVTSNPVVLKGFSAEGVVYAFTSLDVNNWHPLTWLSHMADVSLFGAWAGGHHMVNVLFHAVNAVLLFLLLFRTTASYGRSLFAAALFAVHPLHVESVAWVSERKDVLSGLFFLLTLLAYARYAKRPSPGRCGAVILSFVLGLMSKPMLVTLPFVLLLLDVWPLRRLGVPGSKPSGAGSDCGAISWGAGLREKWPLFALTFASCAVTYIAQSQGAVVAASVDLPFASRVGNALASFPAYLWKTAFPVRLAVLYPHPASFHAEVPAASLFGGLLLLAATTALAFRERLRRPYFLVGWLWFVGMLVPVIGLVQVGAQAIADRYTYLPLIGLFVAVSWGCHEAAERLAVRAGVRAFVAGSLVFALGALSFVQAGYWKDGYTLFSHAAEATENNWMARYNLGACLQRDGRLQDARREYEMSLRIKPDYPDTHQNLATVLQSQGALGEASAHFKEAIRLDPGYYNAHLGLAMLYYEAGMPGAAVPLLRRMLAIRPGDPMAAGMLNMIASGMPGRTPSR